MNCQQRTRIGPEQQDSFGFHVRSREQGLLRDMELAAGIALERL
jgi:hypothetical protein